MLLFYSKQTEKARADSTASAVNSVTLFAAECAQKTINFLLDRLNYSLQNGPFALAHTPQHFM